MTLADLHRAVRTAITSGRVGSPLFVRYVFHRPEAQSAVATQLARTTVVVQEWVARPVNSIYALGKPENRHVTLTVEFRDGPTALITWIGTTGRGDGVDLCLLGNHGALYHDAGTAELWDEPGGTEAGEPEPALMRLIERAMQSGRPEKAEGSP
jgi:hypothetical protein